MVSVMLCPGENKMDNPTARKTTSPKSGLKKGLESDMNVFDFVSSQWVPEISHHCPRTPFLLVGTQVDLRDDSNTLEKLAKNKQRALTCESGEKLARELKAVKYVECSALTQVHGEGRIHSWCWSLTPCHKK